MAAESALTNLLQHSDAALFSGATAAHLDQLTALASRLKKHLERSPASGEATKVHRAQTIYSSFV